MSLHAAHISFMKLFRFTESIFEPGMLEKEIEFLSNPKKIRKRINSTAKQREIEGIGKLKRIKNPNIPEDNFWSELQRRSPASSRSRRKVESLPYYPFQLIPSGELKLRIPKMQATGPPILDWNCSYQMRFYPPGIGSFHLRFYYKQRPLNWDFLKWISSGHRPIFILDGKIMNFFDIINEEMGRFFEKCCKSDNKETRIAREIGDYYKVINIQGELEEDMMSSFLSFLDNIFRKEKASEVLTPYEDRIIIGRKSCVLYIDKGLKTRKKEKGEGTETERRKIRRGRRCFRSHIIDTIDLALTSLGLSKVYADYIHQCLVEIEAKEGDASILSIFKDLFESDTYDSNLYSTLHLSLFTVPQKLEETGNTTFKNVYQTIFEVSDHKNPKKLLREMEILHNKAKEFNVKKKRQIKWLYEETQEWILGLLPTLIKVVSSNSSNDDTNTQEKEH